MEGEGIKKIEELKEAEEEGMEKMKDLEKEGVEKMEEVDREEKVEKLHMWKS